MKMMNQRDVYVCFPVKVPNEVLELGTEKVYAWLRKYLQEMAGSNDGSELLANMEVGFETTVFPSDPRVVDFVMDDEDETIKVSVLSPAVGDHPLLIDVDLIKGVTDFSGYD